MKYLLVRQQTLSSGDQILKVIKITFEILSLCAKKLLSKIGQDDHSSCSECKQTKSSHNWLKVDFWKKTPPSRQLPGETLNKSHLKATE